MLCLDIAVSVFAVSVQCLYFIKEYKRCTAYCTVSANLDLHGTYCTIQICF